MLDPGDPTALTNSAGQYDFSNQPAGTYTVGLAENSLGLSTPLAAYTVPSGTIGNQANSYSFGMSFTIDQAVQLTSLGVFDSGSGSLKRTLTAILYNAVTKTALAQMVFTPSDPGLLVEEASTSRSRPRSLCSPGSRE